MYIVYGLGEIGKAWIEKVSSAGKYELALTDSDVDKWGKSFLEYTIQAPEIVLKYDYDKIIITVGNKYFIQIKELLIKEYHVEENKIFSYRDILIVGQNYSSINLGDLAFSEDKLITEKELREGWKNLNSLEDFFFNRKHSGLYKVLHYFEAYDRFFSRFCGKDVVILEIGVFQGGSLQMWKNYFQKALNKVTIYGIDIDPECRKYESENIHILIGSQEDRDFLKKIKDQIGKVDILIDDGGHMMQQQIITFEELFDMVSEGGVYLCEDLHTSYWNQYGGGYRKNSFIEYSKNWIDYIHAPYAETEDLKPNKYTETIKSITYYDSMVFIEKKKRTGGLFSLLIENN